MAEYIDKSALYEKIAQLEKLARNRYLETPSSSACCAWYMTQLNERTVFKHIIADFPAADVAPVRHGRWERTTDGAALCTACKRKMNPSQYGYAFCSLCGAKMDLEDER